MVTKADWQKRGLTVFALDLVKITGSFPVVLRAIALEAADRLEEERLVGAQTGIIGAGCTVTSEQINESARKGDARSAAIVNGGFGDALEQTRGNV